MSSFESNKPRTTNTKLSVEPLRRSSLYISFDILFRVFSMKLKRLFRYALLQDETAIKLETNWNFQCSHRKHMTWKCIWTFVPYLTAKPSDIRFIQKVISYKKHYDVNGISTSKYDHVEHIVNKSGRHSKRSQGCFCNAILFRIDNILLINCLWENRLF